MDDCMTANEISEVLRGLGVAFKEIKITRAFAKAGSKIDATKTSDKTCYKIMQKGIDYLLSKAGNKGVEVYYVEGDKPRTSHQTLKDVISKTKGMIKILDPYYGLKTLDMLEKIDHGTDIKFLTAQLSKNESAKKFSSELVNFEKEHQNILLSRYPRANELHDRYIVTDDTLIILGHGIKDLGGRESFVLVFKGDSGKDLRAALNQKFADRWQNSSKLQ